MAFANATLSLIHIFKMSRRVIKKSSTYETKLSTSFKLCENGVATRNNPIIQEKIFCQTKIHLQLGELISAMSNTLILFLHSSRKRNTTDIVEAQIQKILVYVILIAHLTALP